MIRSAGLFLLLISGLSACFLAREYKPSQFTYNRNGQVATLPLIVPKGYLKEEQADTAGVTLHTFYYSGGALLYAAYLTDTNTSLQSFDERMHQPQIHRLGGVVFKGQDEKELYYREIRQGNLRFGYQQVPKAWELLFDSATNFASLQKKR